MKTLKGHFTNIPLLILVLANMAPIYGVVVFGWDACYIFDFLFIIFNFLSSTGDVQIRGSRFSAGVLIVLIVLKTIIDVKFHLRQHRKNA